MRYIRNILIFLTLAVFVSSISWAEEAEKTKTLQGIEFLTGFGTGKLHGQGNYQLVPFLVDLDFNLRPILKRKNINLPGLVQFILEPFISAITSPRGNVEVGNNFLIKIGFLPETSKFQPYFKGGTGVMFTSLHTREQGTQFNFNEVAGVGMHYFFQKNIALTVEYRFRHISNCGVDSPNHGINQHFGVCGLSYLF